MRCSNCGWNNPDEAEFCQKCNEPLDRPEPAAPTPDPSTPSNSKESVSCLKCGYPVSSEDEYCPNCGATIKRKQTAAPDYSNRETNRMAAEMVPDITPEPRTNQSSSSLRRTIREDAFEAVDVPSAPQGFTLVPADAFYPDSRPVSFNEKDVIIKRDNLDAGNCSIAESGQARICFENGKWYIEDNSSRNSTFIVVNGKTEIHHGDIIVFGNRKYYFE